MNGYSKDLRLRVLRAVDRGTPRVEIVRLFGVSLATIGRYVKRRRETGEVAPRRPSPGRTPTIHRHRKAEAHLVGTAREASRGDAGGALRTVGAGSGRKGLGRDDEPADPSARVDLQAKTLAAAERDEHRPEALGAGGQAYSTPEGLSSSTSAAPTSAWCRLGPGHR